MIENHKIGVSIPCYKVEKQIEDLIASIPDYVDCIVTVNDCSPDHSGEILNRLAKTNTKLKVIHRKQNGGVGAAIKDGFKHLEEVDCDILIKLDGDGQMDPVEIKRLVTPIIKKEADYCKGNRFSTRKHFGNMPAIRAIGNIGLSFLTKLSSGYWKSFDPQNGYLCIRKNIYTYFDHQAIDNGYFFENSMLILLNIHNGICADIDIPAIYGNEKSNMDIKKILLHFPGKLIKGFFRRMIYKYLLYDFSPIILLWFFGSFFLSTGLIFGSYKWYFFNVIHKQGAPVGTITIALLLVLSGFELLLQGLILDIQNSQPLSKRYRQ